METVRCHIRVAWIVSVGGAADTMTLAFLVVLESLSPAERAVFLLHVVDGRVAEVQAIRNPDKLAHLSAGLRP